MSYNLRMKQIQRTERRGLESNLHSRKGSALARTLLAIVGTCVFTAGTVGMIAGSLNDNKEMARFQYCTAGLNYAAAGLLYLTNRKRE